MDAKKIINIIAVIIIVIALISGISLMVADYFVKGDYLLDAGLMTTILGAVAPGIVLLTNLLKKDKE